jgi:hypothetical protein
MHGRNRIFAALIFGAFLALPTGAVAQSSEGGYNQPGGVVQDQIQPQPAQTESQQSSTPSAANNESQQSSTPSAANNAAPAARTDHGGELPFTGLDLVLVVMMGGVLVLLGFGIRRLARPTETV